MVPIVNSKKMEDIDDFNHIHTIKQNAVCSSNLKHNNMISSGYHPSVLRCIEMLKKEQNSWENETEN